MWIGDKNEFVVLKMCICIEWEWVMQKYTSYKQSINKSVSDAKTLGTAQHYLQYTDCNLLKTHMKTFNVNAEIRYGYGNSLTTTLLLALFKRYLLFDEKYCF